jgi:hypothetical protein
MDGDLPLKGLAVTQSYLSEPVEFGDIRLAPTVELAGLAELSALDDHDARLDAILRIAASIESEDQAREHVARLRDGTATSALPKRR